MRAAPARLLFYSLPATREYFYPSHRSNIARARLSSLISSPLLLSHRDAFVIECASPSPHAPPRSHPIHHSVLPAPLPSARSTTAPADRNKLYIVHNKIGTVTNDMCIMRAEFYERTVAQRYEGYRIIAAFAICIVGSPLLILFIVSFITGMTRFFQRQINYTQHCAL